MSNMRKAALGATGVLLSFGLMAPLLAQSTPPAGQRTSQRNTTVEFVQTATGFTFRDGKLTLNGVSPATVFFSDRPQRMVGHVRNDEFLRQWSQGPDSFASDPPNATLSMFQSSSAGPSQAVLTISNPQISGSSLTYDAAVIQGDIPAQGGSASLFIDGSNAPCTSNVESPYFSSGSPCWAVNAFASP